jgi:hypothetical protein
MLCLLQGPQGQLNKSLLLARFKRLTNEGKLEAMWNFVQASRGVKTMDLAPIYMMMLQLYSMYQFSEIVNNFCIKNIHMWLTERMGGDI